MRLNIKSINFRRLLRTRRLNRSIYGDIFIFVVLLCFGSFSAVPLIFTINNAFKPFDEIFRFPPRLFVKNPTLDNFTDLMNIMNASLVPFSRHIMNTVVISFLGTTLHIFISSMAAFILAKYRVYGKKLLFTIVVMSLMFSSEVTSIPNYLVIARLNLVDTMGALIIPSIAASLGLYLMKQFMEQIPTELIECAEVEGANEFHIYFKIALPIAKPATLTLFILQFQAYWKMGGGRFIYDERLKTLSNVFSQVSGSSIARAGVGGAASLVMILVPITVFIIMQSSMIETMAQSGIK